MTRLAAGSVPRVRKSLFPDVWPGALGYSPGLREA